MKDAEKKLIEVKRRLLDAKKYDENFESHKAVMNKINECLEILAEEGEKVDK